MTRPIEVPVPAHALPHQTPRELLSLARQGIAEAVTDTPGLRYSTAHLAALRAAAAVLSARAVPAPPERHNRATSVWDLLVLVAPELSEWATYFASAASKRVAVKAGIPCVTALDANELTRAAEQFIDVVALVVAP